MVVMVQLRALKIQVLKMVLRGCLLTYSFYISPEKDILLKSCSS